ncbi:phosphoribosylaminoimidazole carboxylase, ATPase subunit [Gluconacetobacter diazotrophicus PA1 5]|uniref:N5-carboxyaminoimidazole ribonucleotide synthase n=1 Tax=Gluconacetobacter diazotrophicus (strain ATCC 49037 / DSM 5601 / CCUG 37298 / CIP 103539 / LMG 7603 / PAl5) TaxID=272568 RepID=A9HHQ5_GLUDA|nr:5-(carboxyamino)imidazole ribonucleotide synthase [Gluconacetobacter diazotrophicus]ACI53229.1 phosphoribosylaminoimidazole carboxylase, ATPase subunit [Gluconacetobacter diazotrophicus PA1 5]TWB10396.1 5-(carboxyamino)imidazole ribonucleotide synthase [Gluconacetobacter diazotrophicus]CAP55667.1 putative phosphoribosylaminoimidazole carboxylase ATPase subunit [Gluconacetobacter diazotrophicus PA1 5]
MSAPFPEALPAGAVLGIVGGGQLGRMSAVAAAQLGFRAHILTDEAEGPAAQVAHAVTVGAYDDPDVLRRFASSVDVVTFEFENISADGLELLAGLCPVRPSGRILRISQDRIAEKRFLAGAGIPLAPWAEIHTPQDLDTAIATLGLPFILKTTRLGYDGKGQHRVHAPDEALPGFHALAPHPLVAEAMIDFACEVSVMVARGLDGTAVTFDVTENRHRNGILDISLAPARVSADIAEQARDIAMRVATALDLVGLLGVEMFVDRDGRVLVNEIAPRPHNSGHWTMDACPVDQFAMHVRAVTGLPLPPAVRHSDAVMKNLVGPDDMALWPAILATPGLLPHHYGKEEARPGRKMGHVNVLFPHGGLPGEFGVNAALAPCLRNS